MGDPKEPRKCRATSKSTGKQCRRNALDGAVVCDLHGGKAPQVKAAAERRLQAEEARRACDRLGVAVEVDPGEALMQELWETAGNVAFYRELVQQLPTHPEADEYVAPEGDGDGHWERGESGVYGRTYHVSGIPTGEAKPNVLVVLYNEERKHLAAVATAALKAGVEERRVQMAEQQGQLLAQVIKGVLTELGVMDRPEVPAIVRRHLTLAAGSA